ncbi:histidinol-phosphate aminotransferase family protein [Saccharolobus solfataricus]|uniref:histidinol-phosphate transaminase n=3 Tax=Saccharolobus solfataricus TaxID=2287 RepID=Q97ZX4_SACS2|nr:histidinol-phosphate transaminase [Saccharolobus solfataricus]AAK40774.1 Histidinol-phosphate aminotransferase, putative (hisC-like) [Saccharolobus solfataricus P2]AKA73749.1 histidinol-phosphate aminotransferase family protein [Saccharolobus solfataricus]AKA76446.1 histidinol-phosphate aminotransferase family protein [Saccharolobus solfataricus]AKA79139.1 histidinol-phosphate aminotransferase family protein [Saccharolobus solfataricus]AZF68222.1 histidinol-phosphate aminotransferase family
MKHGGYPWKNGKPALDVKDFSVNLNPMGVPKFIEELINEAVKLKVYAYYPPQNLREIKGIIAEIYGVNEDLVGVFNGASEVISILDENFTVPQPNYSEYKFHSYYFAEEHEDEFVFELNPGRILTSNPNNPTGSLIKLDEIEEFLINEKNELILDESFIDISLAESATKLVNEFNNLTIINSFTKSLAIPGLRFGFSIGHKSKELEKRVPIWRINSITYYVISNLNPKEVRSFFVNSKIKVKEIYDKVDGVKKLFKMYKSYAPFFLVEFKIPTSLINDELIRRCKCYIRDASNFLGLRNTHARIALKNEVIELINNINEIISEKES